MGDFYNRGGGAQTVTTLTADDLEVDSGTLSIDADNDRVGIGTDSPGVQLEVQDTTTSSANAGGALRLSANDGAAMGDSHRLGVIEFTGAEDTSNTQVVGARIEAMTDAAWTNAENGCALYFYTTDGNASQTNVFKLDSNKRASFTGTVGIGDSVPGTPLQITDTAPYVTLKNSTSENTAGGCESKIIFEDHGDNALGQIEVSHVGSSDDAKGQLILSTNSNSGLAAALTIDEAQKVGIGTTDPGNILHVAGADAYLTLQNTSAENGEGGAETRVLYVDHAGTALAMTEGSHSGTADDTKGKFVVSTHTGSALTAALTIDDTQKSTFAGDVVVNNAFAAAGASGTFGTFSDGDATPSVAAGNLWKHHASIQTITMFDDGVAGQVITVISTAAITYDVTSTNLKGGSVDIVTATGDVTQWCFDGTNWYLLQYMDVSADHSVIGGGGGGGAAADDADHILHQQVFSR